MNKYTKAFEHLQEHANGANFDDLVILKELVIKSIPKNLVMKRNTGRTYLKCPVCNATIDNPLDRYCYSCGQALK